MITAVDTNILLDILIPDKAHFNNSKMLLDEHLLKGRLIICEIVYAELSSQFFSEKELMSFLTETGIRLIPSDERALYFAGERWKEYAENRRHPLQCRHCGRPITVTCPKCHSPIMFRQHILSDFVIGAHALSHADLLLTRDRGFYKTYFNDLKIIQ